MNVKSWNKCRNCGKYISKFARYKKYCLYCGMEINDVKNMIMEGERKKLDRLLKKIKDLK